MRVVIVGAGFGGMEAAKGLRYAAAEVIVLDRQNHQCFQPLLYQVATAALTPADIAWPIRALVRGQHNTQVFMAEVTGVDLEARRIDTDAGPFDYDVLLIATGATHSYFGHDEWAPFAPGLKRIGDATAIRGRLLLAFERAELAGSDEQRRQLTTFVVVGGGPTGVEMAGAISDMARQALPRDFRRVQPENSRIVLVEAGPRILPTFPERLARTAEASLRRKGVEVLTGSKVTGIDAAGVLIGSERLLAGAVIWAAGVAASPAARWLGVQGDRVGRVRVNNDLTLPGHPEVFVIGDTALVGGADGKPVPGVAPAAKQMGRYAAKVIQARLSNHRAPGPFAYRDEGELATIGRNSAVVRLHGVDLTGLLGWWIWGAAHIYFLIGIRNRIGVAFSWLWEYATFSRRSRLIVEQGGPAPPPQTAATHVHGRVGGKEVEAGPGPPSVNGAPGDTRSTVGRNTRDAGKLRRHAIRPRTPPTR